MKNSPPPGESHNVKDPSSVTLSEKSVLLNKSSSFSAVHAERPRPRAPRRALSSVDESCSRGTIDEDKEDGEPECHRQPTLDEVSHEIDGFIDALSSMEDKSNAPEIPKSLGTFANMIQSEIDKYESGDSPLKFGQDLGQDTLVINAVNRTSKLIDLLENFPSDNKINPSLTLMILILQRAMSIMEEDLRVLLEDSMKPPSSDSNKTPKSNEPESTEPDDQKPKEDKEEHKEIYPGISLETANNMKMIASTMISAGYEAECCMAYVALRRSTFKKAIKQQGLHNISMDEVQKMQWEPLEGHISAWIKVVKHVSQVLLPGERRLCEFLFSSSSIADNMIANLARSVAILFTNFAEAVAMTKRSAERLFKVLDVYEALNDLTSAIEGSMGSHETANELRSEISSVRSRLGEAAVCIFCDLENSIKNDVARTPVPNGAVHPLTRYTMNYLRYTCDFKQTLEEVFSLHRMTEQRLERLEPRRDDSSNNSSNESESSASKQTPFALELMTIMNLLDANLEQKSKLYKDLYILQKIKESTEIHGLVENDYRRRKSSELRGYHKSYQRETWGRALQCLNQEGLQVNGKVHKPILKDRFKSFNQIFDEIQRTQSSWVVSDEQLQSELQVSISAVMIPAYRSFLGRFGQYFTPGRQYEKYVKYQPEDIESAIEGLFDGSNQNFSMARRR
ncbi:hypothetical protein Cgig2_028527 [Carnegiea gigantea]|uniref:Exocyst subunit Exo70 family protein n=1 Tax=Carnegiea gigantea TaxID=171969 RepID=A0A9Q1JWP6_9CARY|nr:hypothetical protein Cgig2_028527 [Carnegiea gigantea]